MSYVLFYSGQNPKARIGEDPKTMKKGEDERVVTSENGCVSGF